jgi:PadR family transcriptional regulator AphA
VPRETDLSPKPVLLGLLMLQPRHGYELHQAFSQELGWVWHIGRSQLYAQLKQLDEAGLVTARLEPQPNRPPRQVYRLTSEGRAAFLDWVHQPTPYLRHIRVEFLARLYFYRLLPLPGLEQLVAKQKAVCQAQIERFGRMAGEAEDDARRRQSFRTRQSFRRLVLEFRQGQLEAVVRWLDRCVEIL